MKRFKHSGSVGDIIASLSTIRELVGPGEQCVLYLQVDVPGKYGPMLRHPSGKFRMSREIAEKLLPLLQSQPMFESVSIWGDEPFDIDLDDFRTTGFNFAAGNLARYYCHVHPVCPRLWEPWLDVVPDDEFRGTILVNRTARYHAKKLDYGVLAAYPDVRFLGLPDEYRDFRQAFRVNVPHFLPRTFLETARAIAGARLFIGNQSSAFWIAEGLKVRRILEVCPQCPNVSPAGPNGYEFIDQRGLESLLERLA
jgi:hypothetical protein